MEKKLKGLASSQAQVSPERSRIMSRIRSKGNRSTELRLRMFLVRSGIKGWEMHRNDLPGNPDFYFPSKHQVIFVDGCFWHGCPRCYKEVKSNKKFWKTKIELNKARDKKYDRYYRSQGFKVIRIREHELRAMDRFSLRFTNMLK